MGRNGEPATLAVFDKRTSPDRTDGAMQRNDIPVQAVQSPATYIEAKSEIVGKLDPVVTGPVAHRHHRLPQSALKFVRRDWRWIDPRASHDAAAVVGSAVAGLVHAAAAGTHQGDSLLVWMFSACAAAQLGWGWAVWDWKAGFKYWDGDRPVVGMHEALFGGK